MHPQLSVPQNVAAEQEAKSRVLEASLNVAVPLLIELMKQMPNENPQRRAFLAYEQSMYLLEQFGLVRRPPSEDRPQTIQTNE